MPSCTSTTDVAHDVVVVGAGIMGLAAAHALAREGTEVVVLEQFQLGHDRGSSHGSSRIFRLTYDDPEWVQKAQEALPLWRELEQTSGRSLLALTGSLDVGRDQDDLRRALEEAGAEYELLSAADVEWRYGVVPREEEVLLQPLGGPIWAKRALEALAADLVVREHTAVERLDQTGSGVRLETTGGPVEAAVAVVAAGAWTGRLLATTGVDVGESVTRETTVYFELEGAGSCPTVVDWDVAEGRHGFSLPAGPDVLKAGLHHSGVPAEPDEPGEPDPEVVAAVADWVQETHPAALPAPLLAETCLYTSREDDRFFLERDGPIVACSACSGHGFKFAPWVGRRVAELATEALAR
jgi:monomeric sarcosine oxidase